MSGKQCGIKYWSGIILLSVILIVGIAACVRPAAPDRPPYIAAPLPSESERNASSPNILQPGEPTQPPEDTTPAPTPDSPHPVPPLRQDTRQYQVQPGDTLLQIANAHNVGLQAVIDENALINPDILSVGQILTIPPPDPKEIAPSFKIVPNSELVFGPSSADFNIGQFISQSNGYVATYLQEIGDEIFTGPEIVLKVAQNYSVNPRLLLAILEYQSGWVTQRQPADATLDYPLGVVDPRRTGLYRQLTFTANNLNRGYYLWQVNGAPGWVLPDGAVVPANPQINAGTAGVQHFFSQILSYDRWLSAVSADGTYATYTRFFGNPFATGFEPVIPSGITQPEMQLPFEDGDTWSFTGGPHASWDSGSPWGGLDFAPPGDALGCVDSNIWVTAVADGYIIRAGDGAVLQDLSGDGLEQTGWTVLYMHIATRGRILPGTWVSAGDRIGHPSCEGGFSSGTHLHISRRYNGEWLPADQPGQEFILEGWVSSGSGREYNGYMTRTNPAGGVERIEAWNGRTDFNQIQR